MAVKQVTISGKTYYLDQLQHSVARSVFVILLRNLGPGAGELMTQLAAGKGLGLDPRAIGRAIQDVCLRLNADDLGTISEAFGTVSNVNKNGKRLELSVKAQDDHFKGAMGEWCEWMLACVEHNYADFLELLTRAMPSASVGPVSPQAEKAAE